MLSLYLFLEDTVAERDKEITRLKDLIEKAKQEGQSLGKEELEALTKERDELKAEIGRKFASVLAYPRKVRRKIAKIGRRARGYGPKS